MDEENKEEYSYRYAVPTASERREIEEIRRQYMAEGTSEEKLKKLLALDAKVKNIPPCVALTFGIIGGLTFGIGLTFILQWNNLFAWGVVLGVLGLCLTVSAGFVYRFLSKYLKNKYRKKILEICDELIK